MLCNLTLEKKMNIIYREMFGIQNALDNIGETSRENEELVSYLFFMDEDVGEAIDSSECLVPNDDLSVSEGLAAIPDGQMTIFDIVTAMTAGVLTETLNQVISVGYPDRSFGDSMASLCQEILETLEGTIEVLNLETDFKYDLRHEREEVKDHYTPAEILEMKSLLTEAKLDAIHAHNSIDLLAETENGRRDNDRHVKEERRAVYTANKLSEKLGEPLAYYHFSECCA